MLGVHRTTFFDLIAKGLLASVLIGRGRLVSLQATDLDRVSEPGMDADEGVRRDEAQHTEFLSLAPHLAHLFACLFGLGLRRGGALGLTWADVEFDSGRVRVRQSLQRL